MNKTQQKQEFKDQGYVDIDGYCGDYMVNVLGSVVSFKFASPKIISSRDNNKGYPNVRLSMHMKSKSHYLHRLVFHHFIDKLSSGMEVDHIDGDNGNFSVSNLRQLTRSQNRRAAKRKSVGKTSKYRGVYFSKRAKRWISEIFTDDKKKYLGTFMDESIAALAWNEAAIKLGYEKEALNVI